MSSVEPRERRSWKPVLLVLLVFGAGLIAGAGGTVVLVQRRVQAVVNNPEAAGRGFERLVARRLGLDPEQRRRLAAIVARRQRRLQALRRHYQPLVDRELQAASSEIEAILRPEQRARWSRLTAAMRRWRPALPPEPAP